MKPDPHTADTDSSSLRPASAAAGETQDGVPLGDTEEATGLSEDGSSSIISPRKILWPIGLSLAVLAIIAAFTFDPDELGRMLRALDPWIMAGALATVAMRILFGGWRLSHVSNGRLTLASGLRGQLAWDFASNITPSLVGGAPLAALYVSRDTKTSTGETSTVGEIGALMLFVMLLDQCWFAVTAPLVLIAAPFIPVIPTSLGSAGVITTVLYLVLFMSWTAVFGYGTLFRPELLERFLGRLFRLPLVNRLRDKMLDEMGRYREQAAAIRSQPIGFFAKGFVLTAGTWIARYLLAVFIIRSVVPDLDLVLATARSIAMTLGTLVLPTPGGAGGVEGLYVLFFGSLMPRAYVVPTLLVWRLMAYYIFVAVGVALSTHQVHKSLRWRRLMPSRTADND